VQPHPCAALEYCNCQQSHLRQESNIQGMQLQQSDRLFFFTSDRLSSSLIGHKHDSRVTTFCRSTTRLRFFSGRDHIDVPEFDFRLHVAIHFTTFARLRRLVTRATSARVRDRSTVFNYQISLSRL
jgi:hypothetical protein